MLAAWTRFWALVARSDAGLGNTEVVAVAHDSTTKTSASTSASTSSTVLFEDDDEEAVAAAVDDSETVMKLGDQ
jgi:hypothetical protein